MINKRALYIGDSSIWSIKAENYLRCIFLNVDSIQYNYDKDKPPSSINWFGDWIFSFKSDLILPIKTLNSAKEAAINFHPAPPKYRGIGGYNYALQNKDLTYGSTCHYMDEKIDHGEIIDVSFFSISSKESIDSLKDKTAAYCLTQFMSLVTTISNEDDFPHSNYTWSKKLHTRKMLSEVY
ncbi:formyltransferase family protein [Vreelandella titanicae]|uniref:formyltransferase family protein n=1 Tax=Vreelandella titanicae TaxID=664683 RepID=UPI001680FFC4|nr:formyltransferase family protein [Halomonas titanicae]QNU60677.1 hypothetical protein HZS52_12785 [Halomonas titanicae]